MKENHFYVYAHYKADSGEIFYIGKGLNFRAHRKTDRNIDKVTWKNIVSSII